MSFQPESKKKKKQKKQKNVTWGKAQPGWWHQVRRLEEDQRVPEHKRRELAVVVVVGDLFRASVCNNLHSLFGKKLLYMYILTLSVRPLSVIFILMWRGRGNFREFLEKHNILWTPCTFPRVSYIFALVTRCGNPIVTHPFPESDGCPRVFAVYPPDVC